MYEYLGPAELKAKDGKMNSGSDEHPAPFLNGFPE
jgi:hypothetical protein